MIAPQMLALLCNDPSRAHVALAALSSVLGFPHDADAVGFSVTGDGSVLLQHVTPSHLSILQQQQYKHAQNTTSFVKSSLWASLLGPVRGRAVLTYVRCKTDLRPQNSDATLDVGPFRFRSFSGAVWGGAQDADQAVSLREQALRGLPDSLHRAVLGQSEGEAFFFDVMRQLYERHLLDAPRPTLEPLGPILAHALQADTRRSIVLSTGFGVVGGWRDCTGLALSMEGLPEDVAAEIDTALVDSSTARERLRRFRATLLLGPFAASTSHDGATQGNNTTATAFTSLPFITATHVCQAGDVVGIDTSLRIHPMSRS